ncbi:phosphatidylinositol 4-kinase [Nocardia sp. alder85J]|uniref:phosphatidylinositol 4-kinase n=1 Tax=Nocardia sp. alder85J TaxID=2862949 RepID=UPI001CD289A4|nr:phosphatidylinositol 4-kinase [Nocardia sp. alder85J]MCX4093414.1 hypothetical protein [Nocardia sp. alder85J]
MVGRLEELLSRVTRRLTKVTDDAAVAAERVPRTIGTGVREVRETTLASEAHAFPATEFSVRDTATDHDAVTIPTGGGAATRDSTASHADIGSGRAYRPSPAESAMRTRTGLVEDPDAAVAVGARTQPIRPVGARPQLNRRPALAMRSDDGELGIYKPAGRERQNMREGIPNDVGEQAKREVAAARTDELLQFGLVPPTALVDGPLGSGSLQQLVQSTEGRAIADYPRVQQERMAVLDYVIGNTDRYGPNYRTTASGDLVAIDHGLTFPESPDPQVGIMSEFVHTYRYEPLSEEVLNQVTAVDPAQLRSALEDLDLHPDAVNGALARLQEIADHGMITGDAWPGRITVYSQR